MTNKKKYGQPAVGVLAEIREDSNLKGESQNYQARSGQSLITGVAVDEASLAAGHWAIPGLGRLSLTCYRSCSA